jgi:hypothetical protein
MEERQTIVDLGKSVFRSMPSPVYRQRGLTIAGLIFGTLFIRLSYMLVYETYLFTDDKSFGAEMGWIAYNLVEGDGFTVGGPGGTVYYAWMAPLFPFLVALIFGIFGSYTVSSAVAVLVMQSIISSLVVVPLYLIAEEIFNRRVAITVAILWALHPGSISFAAETIWSSSLTALGLTTAFWLVLRIRQNPKSNHLALLCGMVIGFTALSNPVALSIVPAAVLWLIWWPKENNLGAMVVPIISIGLAATVVITPWTIRNYVIFQQFVPIKSTFGVNVWQGNHGHNINQPTAGIGFGYRVLENFSTEEFNYLVSLNEVERASFFFNEALAFIVDNPTTFVYYTVWRIYLFWRLFVVQVSGIFLLPYYFLITVGFLMSRQQWKYIVLFLLFFALFPLSYYFSIVDTYRYRFPIEGLLLIPLAHSLWHILRLVYTPVSKNVDQWLKRTGFSGL